MCCRDASPLVNEENRAQTLLLPVPFRDVCSRVHVLPAKGNQRLSTLTNVAPLGVEAAESAQCGYLSLIAIRVLLVNTIWQV